MTALALPALTENVSALDWPDAAYRTEVRFGDGEAEVRQDMRRAPALAEIAQRSADAVWAAELRCPRTLTASTEKLQESSGIVRWRPGDAAEGNVYVIPGLIAVRDFEIERPEGLHDIWGEGPFAVRAGQWLARGAVHSSSTLSQALLSFRRDADLRSGGMAVRYAGGIAGPLFVASLAADVWERGRSDRSVQISALIGACARFGSVFGDGGEDDHRAIAGEIRARLLEANIPAWDEDDWDPAQAATLIEGFRFHDGEETDDA